MTSKLEQFPGLFIRPFAYPDDYQDVISLWRQAGPGVNLGRSDAPAEIEKKLQRDPDLFLVAEAAGQIVGAVIGGYDGRRGLIYHLAVSEPFRAMGLGSALMDELEERLRARGCLKSYLLVLPGNDLAAQFYEKRGWKPMPVTIYGKDLQ